MMTLLRLMLGDGNPVAIVIFQNAALFYTEVLPLTRLDPIRLPTGL
jgi:hypothetical protein